jgi:hypothetical protein
MSTLKSFTMKARRPVLIATAIGTVPSLLFLVWGIIAVCTHTQDFGLGEVIVYTLIFAFSWAITIFIIATIIAFAWYLLRQTWRKRELRRIGKRFGWTPQAK